VTRNLGRVDQFLRIVVGLALVAYTVKDGPPALGFMVAGAVGVVLLITAFFSYCPLYTLFGISTRNRFDRPT